MPFKHGIVDDIVRVPMSADSIDLLKAVGAALGMEWSEGQKAAIIRHLLATHPEVLRTGKAQRIALSKQDVAKMFDIRRGVRVNNEKDGVR